jgi:hypothetical protein
MAVERYGTVDRGRPQAHCGCTTAQVGVFRASISKLPPPALRQHVIFEAVLRARVRGRSTAGTAEAFGRDGSLQDLCGFLSELHSMGIDLFLHQQGIDTIA